MSDHFQQAAATRRLNLFNNYLHLAGLSFYPSGVKRFVTNHTRCTRKV